MSNHQDMNNQYNNMLEALEGLKLGGYEEEFLYRDGKMLLKSSGKKYLPEDLVVTEFHRFEGETNVSDMSIVYALRTNDGEKGLVINAFGVYGNGEIDDFLQDVEIQTA